MFKSFLQSMRMTSNGRSTTLAALAVLERLESRQLLTTFASFDTYLDSNGTMHVYGTGGDDVINVFPCSVWGSVVPLICANRNGRVIGSFSSWYVREITVRGFGGHDYIRISPEITTRTNLFGGQGNDTIYGGNGYDQIYGEDGNDQLHALRDYWASDSSTRENDLYGGGGNDTLYGGSGRDYLYGGSGDDRIEGGGGNDSMRGEDGSDTLLGSSGNDSLKGDAGNDYLVGYDGDDTLVGGDGVDSLWGGDGNDLLEGGSGQDYMYGGKGDDIFRAKDDERDYIDGGDGFDIAFVDKRPWYAQWEAQDDWHSIEIATEQ